MTTPYYTDDAVTLYHGDAREILPQLAPTELLVTDPPYGISYSGAPVNLGGIAYPPICGDNSTALAEWAIQYPVTVTTVVFGSHEFPHLLRPGGRWFCWDKRLTQAADKMIGTPFELAWSPLHGRNVMFRCLHGGLVNANDPGQSRLHPTEKPIRVLRSLLGCLLPGVVTDPFAGSGTTLRAAVDVGRRAVGVEIEERYCEIAANRLAQGVLDLDMSR